MIFTKTALNGVLIIKPITFQDNRGHFFESYNEITFSKSGIQHNFVQENQSFSSYGVIRGLHAQNNQHAQAKLVRVIYGKVLDVVVDIRKNSPTFGKHISIELSQENNLQLLIPRGFLHGFSVLSETAIFSYKCDNFYNKSAECGVRYDDPSIDIDWKIPKNKIQVSEKDILMGGLQEITPYIEGEIYV
jgi:dTDP-4-dehydrorhamnose 3,5-epimerase